MKELKACGGFFKLLSEQFVGERLKKSHEIFQSKFLLL
jgi:hypothetical protein